MNLGKKLAEGYAVDTESVEAPAAPETTVTGVPSITAEEADAPAVPSAQPVTA
ncbi:MAG: hypothetical protein AB7J32_19500 [Pseudonocardia sp.]